MGPVADDAQGVVALVYEGPGVAVRALEDEVGPALDVVAPELPHLGVVQEGAAVAEAEHDGLDRRAGQLVHAGLVLLPAHGRLVHVDEGVPAVVVEHYLWLCHGGVTPLVVVGGIICHGRVQGWVEIRTVYTSAWLARREGGR